MENPYIPMLARILEVREIAPEEVRDLRIKDLLSTERVVIFTR